MTDLVRCKCGGKPYSQGITKFSVICQRCWKITEWYKTQEEAESAWNAMNAEVKNGAGKV